MKKILTAKIANKTGKTQKDAATALKAVIDAIGDMLMDGSDVRVAGLGTFKVKVRKARTTRNPRTGVAVQVPEKYTITFKADGKARQVACAAATFARTFGKGDSDEA